MLPAIISAAFFFAVMCRILELIKFPFALKAHKDYTNFNQEKRTFIFFASPEYKSLLTFLTLSIIWDTKNILLRTVQDCAEGLNTPQEIYC